MVLKFGKWINKWILNTVIEKLVEFQKQGFGECDVTFNADDIYRIREVETTDWCLTDKGHIWQEWEIEEIDAEEEIVDKETIVTICLGNIWDFGAQIKENQEKIKKKAKQEKLARILENANFSGALQFKILIFLKEVGLNESDTGILISELKELFDENYSDIREALCKLKSQKLIGFIGETKSKKVVAIEFLDQARQNFERKSKWVNIELKYQL